MGCRVLALTPDFITFGAVAPPSRPGRRGARGQAEPSRAPPTTAGTDKGELVLGTNLAQCHCHSIVLGPRSESHGCGDRGLSPRLHCAGDSPRSMDLFPQNREF